MIKIISNLILLSLALLMMQFSFAIKSDKDQPVVIESDQATLNQHSGKTELIGNVIITQGTLKILASKIQYVENSDKNVEVTAQGNPTSFKQQLDAKNGKNPVLIKGSATQIIFKSKTGDIILAGNATIKRNADTIQGDTIKYNRNTEQFSVVGNNKSKKRVMIILQPSSQRGI